MPITFFQFIYQDHVFSKVYNNKIKQHEMYSLGLEWTIDAKVWHIHQINNNFVREHKGQRIKTFLYKIQHK